MNDRKKISPLFMITVFLILCGGVGVFCGIFAYNVLNSNNGSKQEEKDENISEMVSLDINSDEVVSVFNNFVNVECGYDKYFTDKTVVASDIDNDTAFKIAMGTKNEYKKDEVIDENYVLKKIKLMFGDNYNFVHKTYSLAFGCLQFEYDQDSKQYILRDYSGRCGGTCGPTDYTQVEKAAKSDDKIELDIRVLFLGENSDSSQIGSCSYGFYSDYALTNKVVDSCDAYIIDDKYVSEGSLYRLSFDIKDGHYRFVSSTLVK